MESTLDLKEPALLVRREGRPSPMLGHNACWRRQGFPKVASHEAKAMNVWSQVVRSALTEA